ncbi:MAG TPA: DUF1800 domain-containing protein [Phycisphaerales bacterium]|nr:DUF1800 domain-containing protein [Phycisphaerales bacterium]
MQPTITSDSKPEASAPPQPTEQSAPSLAAMNRLSSSLSPIKAKDWGYDQARHLLWRAGFGGSPSQIATLVKWGPEKSVDHLLDYESIPFDQPKSDLFDKDIMRPATGEERGEIARARRMGDEAAVTRLRAKRQEAERTDRQQMRDIQHWWLKRMVETPRPLEEKMTLFWHGHFATSYRTIEDSYHMYMQNQLFRSHAVGSYAKLLFEIIRDPAMLKYLNNDDSRKDKPNENLAREIMELFSLGVGNYTEKDIKEGARALTGYTFDDDEFVFRRNNHDNGVKYILGSSGALDGDKFVEAILRQPACARHMTLKLYRFFALDYPTGRKDFDHAIQGVLSSLESTMLASRYEIKPVLRRLFLSEHFYQPRVMVEQIKSPAQLVVGAIRSLSTPARDLGVLNDAMNMMGQNIFFPPSVKGWDGGRSWINTATMFIRQNILCFLLTGRTPNGFDPLARQERFDPTPLLDQMGLSASSPANEIADGILRFAIGRSEPHNREILVDLLGRQGTSPTSDTLTQAFLLVSAMPEYQLC